MHIQSLIREFLGTPRFAMVGVSRNEKEFSRTLYREFTKNRYEVIPVNPSASEIDGRKCFAHLAEIDPRVSAALIMMPRENTARFISECAEAGISLVWIYGISGPTDVDITAIRRCEEYGIRVIPGYCPFMVMPGSSWFHHLHGTVWKLIGKYPE